jgi:TRAP transporter TAXI family solute receptor
MPKLLGLLSISFLFSACALVVPRSEVAIGTGSPSDASFSLSGSICRLFNLDRVQDGGGCAVVPTANPVATVAQLQGGRIDVGIVPSDVLTDAVAGAGLFATKGPWPKLRVLFSGHADAFTVVVRRDLNIVSAAELKGRRINMGSPESGERVSMERIMALVGLSRTDFSEVRELTLAEQHRALCADELDAIVYEVPHPSGLIEDVIRMCRGVLVNVSGPVINEMLREHLEYKRTMIAGGTYLGNQNDVQTLGVRAVVVTTTDLSDALAYAITKSVFEHFDDFRRLHPAFSMLSVSDMVGASGAVPVHSGATRYYRERGWKP